MAEAVAYPVEVKPDFVARQTKAQPVAALAELIWNALDADATEVAIELDHDGLGTLSAVVVSDNGHGIPHADAPVLFKSLGGSWKKHGAKTKERGRALHGQEGRGRFKALALGRAVEWKVITGDPGQQTIYSIEVTEADVNQVRITSPEPIDGARRGVTVVVRDVKRNFTSLQPENAVQELSETLALYLKNYRDIRVSIGGEIVDPTLVIAEVHEVDLGPLVDDDAVVHEVKLEVIEWKTNARRSLYLCDENGFPFGEVETRFHVGDYRFSAYLKSSYIGKMHRENLLELGELAPRMESVIAEARAQIGRLFRDRAAQKARVVVEEWKAQKVYPFEGEAQTAVETVERQVFDIVAVTVQEASPDLRAASKQQTALHLRMLRHAIERSPEELQTILEEVIRLPKRKQQELATLLNETSLSSVISAASLVGDRLKFLHGLGLILFDDDLKAKLKERSQLHKILETNTWIFGEEYNLWASDRELTTVLKAHKAHLDADLVVDEPVKLIYKKRGIVDLMLSRAVRRHRADDFEHLVVELKAPKVKLAAEHVIQIEEYAAAVDGDDRFKRVPGVRWHFWLVSDAYDDYVARRIAGGADPQRRLISKTDRIAIGVKTWGEIIEENNARLQFIQQQLQHSATDEQALDFLRERHRQFLEGVLIDEEGQAAEEPESPLEPEPTE